MSRDAYLVTVLLWCGCVVVLLWYGCDVDVVYRKTSNKRRVPNKCRVSIKRRGYLSNVQINAGSLIIAGSPINAGSQIDASGTSYNDVTVTVNVKILHKPLEAYNFANHNVEENINCTILVP